MRISAFSVLALGFGLGLASLQLTACSNSADDCNATATCGATSSMPQAGSAGKSGGGSDTGGDGAGGKTGGGSSNNAGTSGSEGVGGEGGNGSGACTGDVSEDAACWTTNELGVFVSSDSGDDSGAGTKEAPFKTITKGIAAAAGKNVYVCVGATDYTEHIRLDAASDGIRIYGGFECTNWTYATTRSAQVLSPSNIALRIDGLKKGAQIENVGFQAADATGTGADASSYGAFVTGSKGVKLTRVELKAGNGQSGPASPTQSEPGQDGDDAGAAPAGSPFTCDASPDPAPKGGTWTLESSCHSQGGPGGTGTKSTATAPSGGSGIPTLHVSPANEIDNGGPGAADINDGKDGLPGTTGDAGALGAEAATTGSFAVAGYLLAPGKAGGSGYPGQGGGGGGASKGNGTCFGASGGAGGMGGCGGTGGSAGEGGGASVGMFSWNSQVALSEASISSATGGAGGTGGRGGGGGAGAGGALGGVGSQGNGIAGGGRGGKGGPGGNGGSGSGGTGGPSYALVYSGAKPSFDATDTTFTAGNGGAAGAGGKLLGAQAPSGSDGASAKEFEVQ